MSEQDPYGQQQPGQQQPGQQPPASGQPGQEPQPGHQPPGYPQPGYQQPGYPQQGFPQQGFGPPPVPKHPQAQMAMVLGIVALGGAAICLLPIFVSPFAWYFGAKARREMAASPGRWSGQGDAQAGFVMGIIGTVLLALATVAFIIGAIVLFAVAGSASYDY